MNVEFERIVLDTNGPKSSRTISYSKFLNKFPIDGLTKFALCEAYNQLNGKFPDTGRINFYNVSQVTIELLKMLGKYDEYGELFIPLKTRQRIKGINKFIEDSLHKGCLVKGFMTIDEYNDSLLKPNPATIISNKVVPNSVYTEKK